MATRFLRWSAMLAFLLIAAGSGKAAAQEAKPQPPFPDDPLALVADGNKFKAQGLYDEAAASYQRALQLDPRSFEAHLGLGMVYDLQGHYDRAQVELDKALAAAPENAREPRDAALTALAVSSMFRGDLEGAQRSYEKLYDFQIATQRLDKAATTAEAIGRAYLDTGDTKRAAQWYQTGQDAVRKMSGLSSDQIDLWQMRWEQAQSRIAARSGNPEEAETHLAAMKALVDKGGLNAAQAQNYQYLVGYNAFYTGNYDDAIAALLKADPRDPTVLTLLAESYVKNGDPAAAKVYADKVALLPAHTLQGAAARQDVKRIDEQLAKEAKNAKEAKEPEKEKSKP